MTCTAVKFGKGPPTTCFGPTDPLSKPPSKLESWFTKEIFQDLFPKSNLGWGPDACFPYSYQSFIIAARYFPRFGTEAPLNGYSADENYKRDLAAFFAHAVQETGENDISLYSAMPIDQADACFYRGGLYNWFEGGPMLSIAKQSFTPEDGHYCTDAGRYCASNPIYDFAYPCNQGKNGSYYKGCYFGRGAIQISYNFNYGAFQRWLEDQALQIDLLTDPNLIMTSVSPPLAIMASLWFYMTPQPPKPAMHDIILGNNERALSKQKCRIRFLVFFPGAWAPGPVNLASGYSGPILGPTSLVINNECNGEDLTLPGGPGENRRIKAFKWFCSYFNVPQGSDSTLTCKNMVQNFDQMCSLYNVSWQPDWSTTWKEQPCDCAPATYGGLIPYYQQNYYPAEFVAQNQINGLICVKVLYSNPKLFSLDPNTAACLKYRPL